MIAIVIIIFVYGVWIFWAYPLYVRRIQPKHWKMYSHDKLLPITVLIPCYNEARTIVKKLDNTVLALGKRDAEILVMNDGSTDATAEQVKNYQALRENVRLIQMPRAGKNAALNAGLHQAHNPIIIVSDANAVLEKNAIDEILQPLADPSVGMVRGQYRPIALQNGLLAQGALLYQRNEGKRFTQESSAGLLHVSGGALQAFRRELVDPQEQRTLTEDWDLTLHIRSMGKYVVYQPSAVATKYVSNNPQEIFRQNVRLTYGSLQTIWKYRKLFLPWKYGAFSVSFFSGKFLQVMSPLLLLAFVLASFINLQAHSGALAYSVLFIEGICLLTGITILFLKPLRLQTNKFFAGIAYFTLLELAATVAWWKILTRQRTTLWEPLQSIR